MTPQTVTNNPRDRRERQLRGLVASKAIQASRQERRTVAKLVMTGLLALTILTIGRWIGWL